MRVNFVTVDVFTTTRFAGIHSGRPQCEGLSSERCSASPPNSNLSETTFVLPPKDLRYRRGGSAMKSVRRPPNCRHRVRIRARKAELCRPVNIDKLISRRKPVWCRFRCSGMARPFPARDWPRPQLLSVMDEVPSTRGAGLLAVAGRYSDDEPPPLHRLLRRRRSLLPSSEAAMHWHAPVARRRFSRKKSQNIRRPHADLHAGRRGKTHRCPRAAMFAPASGVPEDPPPQRQCRADRSPCKTGPERDCILSKSHAQGGRWPADLAGGGGRKKKAGSVTATYIGGRCVR